MITEMFALHLHGRNGRVMRGAVDFFSDNPMRVEMMGAGPKPPYLRDYGTRSQTMESPLGFAIR